jgi:hypothetical protein
MLPSIVFHSSSGTNRAKFCHLLSRRPITMGILRNEFFCSLSPHGQRGHVWWLTLWTSFDVNSLRYLLWTHLSSYHYQKLRELQFSWTLVLWLYFYLDFALLCLAPALKGRRLLNYQNFVLRIFSGSLIHIASKAFVSLDHLLAWVQNAIRGVSMTFLWWILCWR